jgi:CRP-like cAMP-binding protein
MKLDGGGPVGAAGKRKSDRTLSLLENLPLFRGLDARVLAHIAAQAQVIQADRREVLYRKGDACNGFFVVSYGCIRLSLYSDKGQEKPIQLAYPGNSFGEATMFQGLAHYTTGIASEDSSLVYVPRETIVQLLKGDWQLAMHLLANLSYRLHLMVDDIDDFLLKPPAQRLTRYLLRLVPQGMQERGHVRLVVNKRLMAAQLNLQPETLSRYFREFREQGLIAMAGRNITILDVARLMCRSASHD